MTAEFDRQAEDAGLASHREAPSRVQRLSIKRLSAHEVSIKTSRGHEIQGVQSVRDLLGSDNERFDCTFVAVDAVVPSASVWEQGEVRWYRRKSPGTEWRGYYTADLIQTHAQEGDLLVLVRDTQNHLTALVLPAASSTAVAIIGVFGTSKIRKGGAGEYISVHDDAPPALAAVIHETEDLSRTKGVVGSLEASSSTMPADGYEWSSDELILALDLYLTVPEAVMDAHHPALQQLSADLGALPLQRDVPQSAGLLTATACRVKLLEFHDIDPEQAPNDGTATLERKLVRRFAAHPQALANHSAAIRMAIDPGQTDLASPVDGEDYGGAIEGRIVYRLHKLRERSASVARKTKELMRDRLGQLKCEACGCGEEGLRLRFHLDEADLFECHHRAPLGANDGPVTTQPDHLAVLCPTCHRAIHKMSPVPSVESLREIIESKGALRGET